MIDIIDYIINDGFTYTIDNKKKDVFTRKKKNIIINSDLLVYFNYEDLIILYSICKVNKYNISNYAKFSLNIRNLIKNSFKNNGYSKKTKTFNILGIEFDNFRKYIECKFEPWMSWDNYGLYNGELNYGWDIDHITPVSSGKTEEDILKLNHYTNLQPLCSKVNRHIKRDRIDYYK